MSGARTFLSRSRVSLVLSGGEDGIRTRVYAFAERYLATRSLHQMPRPKPGTLLCQKTCDAHVTAVATAKTTTHQKVPQPKAYRMSP